MYCMYANAHRDEKRKPLPFALNDFLGDNPKRSMNGRTKPIWLLSEEEQEEILRNNLEMAKSFAQAAGAKEPVS